MSLETIESNLSLKRREVVERALGLLGSKSIKYVLGQPEQGQSPVKGFDCSGFVRYVLRQSGLVIPSYLTQKGDIRETRHTNELWDSYGAAVHSTKTLPGDLVFFSRNGAWPSHVGILTSADEYVHAPGEDDRQVEISSLEYAAIEPLVGELSNRQVFEINPIGFKSPTYPTDGGYRIHQRILE